MKISLIAAIDKNNLIGQNNQLPWHLPEDLQRFKALTLNKPILMGRKTYESIGKPLPQRRNIVLTHNKSLAIEGCDIVHSFSEATKLVSDAPELMVIGGRSLYEHAITCCQTMYLTIIQASFTGDTYFPAWNEREWLTAKKEVRQTERYLCYEFVQLERRRVYQHG